MKGVTFCHLTILRHLNTKTSLCNISKNGWLSPICIIFRPVRKKLQVTVLLDHPVIPILGTTSQNKECLLLSIAGIRGGGWRSLPKFLQLGNDRRNSGGTLQQKGQDADTECGDSKCETSHFVIPYQQSGSQNQQNG